MQVLQISMCWCCDTIDACLSYRHVLLRKGFLIPTFSTQRLALFGQQHNISPLVHTAQPVSQLVY